MIRKLIKNKVKKEIFRYVNNYLFDDSIRIKHYINDKFYLRYKV
jgi:hypothetical protein